MLPMILLALGQHGHLWFGTYLYLMLNYKVLGAAAACRWQINVIREVTFLLNSHYPLEDSDRGCGRAPARSPSWGPRRVGRVRIG